MNDVVDNEVWKTDIILPISKREIKETVIVGKRETTLFKCIRVCAGLKE